ncbi:MAG: hypothetical protein M1830_005838, partial [Pleopsidium flavum]
MAAITGTAPIPAHELYIEPRQLPKLRSNQGSHVDPSSTGWLRPTAASTSLDEMRKRFNDDGYIWVKELIPREVSFREVRIVEHVWLLNG